MIYPFFLLALSILFKPCPAPFIIVPLIELTAEIISDVVDVAVDCALSAGLDNDAIAGIRAATSIKDIVENLQKGLSGGGTGDSSTPEEQSIRSDQIQNVSITLVNYLDGKQDASDPQTTQATVDLLTAYTQDGINLVNDCFNQDWAQAVQLLKSLSPTGQLTADDLNTLIAKVQADTPPPPAPPRPGGGGAHLSKRLVATIEVLKRTFAAPEDFSHRGIKNNVFGK
jgi:hypothetical protein